MDPDDPLVSITFPIQFWFAMATSCDALLAKVKNPELKGAVERVSSLVEESAGSLLTMLNELPQEDRPEYVDGVFDHLSGDATLTAPVSDWLLMWLVACHEANDLKEDPNAREGYLGIASDIVQEILVAGHSEAVRRLVEELGLTMPTIPEDL